MKPQGGNRNRSRSRSRSRSPVFPRHSNMRLDALTIANLTGTHSTSEREDQSETLSSVMDSGKEGSCFLSDDLGDIEFTDDELEYPSSEPGEHDRSDDPTSVTASPTEVTEHEEDKEVEWKNTSDRNRCQHVIGSSSDHKLPFGTNFGMVMSADRESSTSSTSPHFSTETRPEGYAVIGTANEESDTLSTHQEIPTVTCKVLVVGNAKCGKSSIISRFVSNRFSPEYNSTVGADYAMKDITLAGGRRVRMQLWDIAGQDRFAKLTRAYFRRAKGAIVVCDVTREGTFDAIVRWKEEIDYWCVNENYELPVYLFANKCDLLREVQDSFLAGAKMERMCRDAGFARWHITSAKRGDNIRSAMVELLHDMVETEGRRHRDGHTEESPGDGDSRRAKSQAFRLSNYDGADNRGRAQQTCCA